VYAFSNKNKLPLSNQWKLVTNKSVTHVSPRAHQGLQTVARESVSSDSQRNFINIFKKHSRKFVTAIC